LSQSGSYLQVILCICMNTAMKEDEKNVMKITLEQKSAQITEMPSLETRSACSQSS